MLRPRGLTQETINQLLDQCDGSVEEWLDYKQLLEADRVLDDETMFGGE